MAQIGKYPDAFYRVSVKAVIRNDAGEVLCVKEDSDYWELPGGGIDHGETIHEALKRELSEEIAYDGAFTYVIKDTVSMYAGNSKDYCVMFLIAEVELKDAYEAQAGSGVRLTDWVNPASLAAEDARGTRMIVKYGYDPSHEIKF